jgi:superoxide dismutase, Cu-Zn family
MPSPRLAIFLALALSACTTYGTAAVDRADVPMRDAAGRDLGTLTLANTAGGLLLTGTLSALPAGAHGIHVHAVGRCEPPFDSAGPHWNPANRQHGTANPGGPHLGDMPNITAAPDGSATVSVTTPGGTLRGSDAVMDADGASVVIHARSDDYRTDPSGNSGARIACGVVRSR